jgi:hypothetical protein
MEGIKMIGFGNYWVCGEFIFKNKLRLLETLRKLGYASHERKNEGINCV